MTLNIRVFLLVTAFAIGCAVAPAAITVEQTSGTGFLPGTAQALLSGTTEITGFLLSPAGGFPANTVDMYRFSVGQPFLFAAHTVTGPFQIDDPQLFLFGGSGTGLVWNNDRSLSPSDTQAELPLRPYSAGTYHLAISWFGVDPVDALGQYLFDTLGSNGGGPSGPGGTNPVGGWLDTGAPALWDNMAYSIEMSLTIPEPSTLSLALIAGVFFFVKRRRALSPCVYMFERRKPTY